MTLPIERYHSLINARSFLRRLLDPSQTPRVPRIIRREARYCLKHFPSDYEIRRSLKSPKEFRTIFELPIKYDEDVE